MPFTILHHNAMTAAGGPVPAGPSVQGGSAPAFCLDTRGCQTERLSVSVLSVPVLSLVRLCGRWPGEPVRACGYLGERLRYITTLSGPCSIGDDGII